MGIPNVGEVDEEQNDTRREVKTTHGDEENCVVFAFPPLLRICAASLCR